MVKQIDETTDSNTKPRAPKQDSANKLGMPGSRSISMHLVSNDVSRFRANKGNMLLFKQKLQKTSQISTSASATHVKSTDLNKRSGKSTEIEEKTENRTYKAEFSSAKLCEI